MRSRASQRLQTREQASRLDLECICRKISITSSSGRKVLIRSCPFIVNDQAFSTLETREMRKGRKISEIPQQDSRRRWLWRWRWRWDWYRGEEAVEWAVGGRKGIWGGAFCKLPPPLSLSLSLSLLDNRSNAPSLSFFPDCLSIIITSRFGPFSDFSISPPPSSLFCKIFRWVKRVMWKINLLN